MGGGSNGFCDLSCSQYCGYPGRFEAGNRILNRECIMGPTRIHVLLACQKYLTIARLSRGSK